MAKIALPVLNSAAPSVAPLFNFPPIPAIGGKDKKPAKVRRHDLAHLLRLITDATADLSGATAIRAAARILSAWITGRRARLEAGSGWTKNLRKLASALFAVASGRKPKGLSIFGKGNGKLPFRTFSALPVITCPGAGECANWCYSFRAWRYPGGFARQLYNTLLLWFAPEVIRRAFLALPQGITLRLYIDGDFSSMADIRFWMDCLRQRPDISAYGYSKSWDLLLAHHEEIDGRWPSNYLLNLSSGGRGLATEQQMFKLPITRGIFACVPIRGRYKPNKRGNVGFARYDDHAYYRAVREAARDAGIRKPFLCPGKCGDCLPAGHACGLESMRGVVIANGEH